ncbi:MAG: hypothetical protein AAF565_00465 [Pseudomonadota bacterium]
MAVDPPVVELGSRAAFVLGNGPSLKNVDLTRLSPHATVGMNAAYRHWDRIGWRPTHYACLDVVVGMSHLEEIRKLIREGRAAEGGAPQGGLRPIQHFALRSNVVEALGVDGADERVTNFDALRARIPLLQVDPITTGSHALLWLAHLGFDPIFLLGIDGNYKEIVSGARRKAGIELEIVENSENPNYFFDDYQRPGDRYQVPNPRPGLHDGAWVEAARALGSRQVTVANGNATSSVRVFPFVDAASLVESGEAVLSPREPLPVEPPARSRFLKSVLQRKAFLKKAILVSGAAGIFAGALALLDLTTVLAAFFAVVLMAAIIGLFEALRMLNRLREETSVVRVLLEDAARRQQIGVRQSRDDGP